MASSNAEATNEVAQVVILYKIINNTFTIYKCTIHNEHTCPVMLT